MTRWYNKKWQSKNPTYIGVSVCKEWHSFMEFRSWMMQQEWHGKYLDKDLLQQGNKVYCPSKCVFVSRSINNLLTDSAAKRGRLPIGISFCKVQMKHQSAVKVNGRLNFLGRFKTKEEGHAAWQKAKAEIIEQAANEQTDERIKAALMLRVNQLRDDLANGRETKKL